MNKLYGRTLFRFLGVTAALVIAEVGFGQNGETAKSPFKVKIEDEKAVIVAAAEGPVDPTPRIRFQAQGNMYMSIQNEQGQTLHLSHFPTLLVDGQPVQIGQGQGQMTVTNGKLPKTQGGKDRVGYMNKCVFNDIEVTQWLEMIATKSPAPGQKRRM